MPTMSDADMALVVKAQKINSDLGDILTLLPCQFPFPTIADVREARDKACVLLDVLNDLLARKIKEAKQ